jgi:hypothetical protein
MLNTSNRIEQYNPKGFKLLFFEYRNGTSKTKYQGLGQVR